MADPGAPMYAVTWAGATHAIVPAFEPGLVARTIEAERATASVLVPTMISMLCNHADVASHDMSSVRQVFYGGSPMPSAVQRKAAETIDCAWVQEYGMTEAAPGAAICRIDHRRALAGEEPDATRIRSAGIPLIGVEAEVHRPDGSRAGPGEPGEIWVRGPNVMAGYWRRPEETAAVLDPDGWYHSGDAAYAAADGYLYIIDRIKDMIIFGGEDVYSIECENAIYQHPAVLEAAVFGIPDEQWGERVHAAIVLKPGTTATEDQVIAHCRQLTGGYKLPRSIEFHDLPLPKSGAGLLRHLHRTSPHTWTRVSASSR